MDAGTQTVLPQTGSQNGQERPAKNAKRKWAVLFAGTAAAMLVAGLLYQVFRPLPGTAQERQPQRQAAPGKASLSESVARVNGEIVSQDEVAQECMITYGKEVLDKIINRKIIEQACAEKGVVVSEAEVEAEIVSIAKKFKMEPDQWFKMLQTERNITESQYRRDIIWPMLALKKLAGDEVKITKKQMQEAFVRNYGERVKVKLIVLDNIRRANECWEKANAQPENFGQLVREYSMDAGSRPLEGSVPPIRRYSGNKQSEPIEEAAFKLKKGEISPVVQAGNQYVIMLCEGQTEPVVTEFEEVKKTLYDDLKEEKTQQAVAEVFERIKEEAEIQNYLTGTGTEGKKKTANSAKPGQINPAGAKAVGRNDAESGVVNASAEGRAPAKGPAPRKPAARPQ